MNTVVSYFILGLSLSIPVGPINAAQLNKGIHYGFFSAWLVGLGAMAGDAFFMLLIYFGITKFLTTPFMNAFLWSFGFFVLIYMGMESIIAAKRTPHSLSSTSEPSTKSFRLGFLMAISNPLNILFWLGIYGAILAKTTANYSALQVLLYTGCIFLGIFIWDIVMASLASSFRRLIHSRGIQFLSIVAGLSLIGFGFYFGYQAFSLLFNS